MSAAAKDLTAAIERNEKFERRARIKLESLMAYIDATADWLTVHGELFPRRGKVLDSSVRLYCSAHDGTARVIGASSIDFEWENFSDFQLFTMNVRLANGDVSKVKVYPKAI